MSGSPVCLTRLSASSWTDHDSGGGDFMNNQDATVRAYRGGVS